MASQVMDSALGRAAFMPDTIWSGYSRGDAHRQVAIYDNTGNRTEYMLDKAGSRIGATPAMCSVPPKHQLNTLTGAPGRLQEIKGRE